MIVIPADLPTRLAPLAWMLGTWEGWGMRASADDTPDTAVIEEIRAEICGEDMRLTTSIYEATFAPDVQLDPTWDAATGLRALRKAELFWEETAYISVLPSDEEPPLPGQYVGREFTASSTMTNALAVLWAGIGVGPRVQMVSDVIARGAHSEDLQQLGRMYGLVAGELMWTQERTLAGAEAEVEYSGRLMRTAQAMTESGEAIEGIEQIDNDSEDTFLG